MFAELLLEKSRQFTRTAAVRPGTHSESTFKPAEMMKRCFVTDTPEPIAMFRKGLFVITALAAAMSAQTFEIGGQQSQPPAQQQSTKQGRKAKGASPSGAAQSSEENSLRFGVSIDATREQHAADDALRHNNAPVAYAHAKRSVEWLQATSQLGSRSAMRRD